MPIPFEELMKEKYLDYDSSKYDFLTIIRKIFNNIDDLKQVHKTAPGSDSPGFVSFDNDQGTTFHKQFYNSPHLPNFLALYEQFIKEVIAPMFKGEQKIIYQKKPTFRVHLPNNIAVGQKHRDFDYKHPEGEINFWLPFTSVSGTNGIFVETEPGKGDFHKLEYGQIFRFYGNKCFHYNEPNSTNQTRVSVDFRIIPESKWNYEAKHEGESVKSGLKFNIGSYYDIYELPKELQ